MMPVYCLGGALLAVLFGLIAPIYQHATEIVAIGYVVLSFLAAVLLPDA